jgi:peptide chain release factor 3
VASNSHSIADDVDGDPVFLARNNFNLDYTGKQNSGITFTDVKDVHAHAKRA